MYRPKKRTKMKSSIKLTITKKFITENPRTKKSNNIDAAVFNLYGQLSKNHPHRTFKNVSVATGECVQ